MHRFRLLGNATLIAMGLLALVAISPIGQVIAMLAAISVIGLPIAFLVVALPSVFLVLLASRLTGEAWACFRSGRTGAAIAFALALLLMADFFVFRAWRVNGWLDSRVAALVADDKDQAAATGSIGTLGVLRNTRNASDTDEFVRRSLPTAFVDRGREAGAGADRGTHPAARSDGAQDEPTT